MSIRFTCVACKTVLKIGDRISEQRKVRCTGCGVVILLTPDEDAPDGMTTSIPQQTPKAKTGAASLGLNNWLILGGAAAALLLVLGLWYALSGPGDRGAIEGEVLLDDLPMDSGTIVFMSIGAPKDTNVEIPIKLGHYKASASEGPAIGNNKVMIRGEGSQAVAAKYNLQSDMFILITPGSNTPEPYKVRSH